IAADGEKLTAIAGVRRIDIPAETAKNRLVGWTLRLGEFSDGERAEDAGAIQLASVEHHLRKAGQVVGRGEEARVAGDAAHIAGRRVVNYASKRRSGFGGTLGGRDPRDEGGGRLEHRL